MQTFSFKTAKLTWRVTVEVDRRWVRAATPKGPVHIDFNLLDAVNYWVTRSRGVGLTGHLVIRDRQGRKLALQCAGFGMDRDFVAFLRAASAILAAISEAQPDVKVTPEPTALHRQLMTGIIVMAFAVAAAASYVLGTDDNWTKIAGIGVGALIALGFVLLKYGPLRKKPPGLAPADLVRELDATVTELAEATAP